MKLLYDLKAAVLPASIKDADAKKGIITGYLSAFDNVDSDGDIIRRGAFAKTIKENGPKSSAPRIKHLLNHSTGQPVGLFLDLTEDQKGLAYESQTGKHALGVDFVKMVESGLITEHSIGFKILKRNQLQDYEGYMKNPAKGWFEITEVRLWEGSSLTAWGANSLTPETGMKSATAEDLDALVEKQKAIEKFCRSTDATDETVELLLLECKQLTQIICDLKATLPDKTTKPDRNEAYKAAIKKFTQSF